MYAVTQTSAPAHRKLIPKLQMPKDACLAPPEFFLRLQGEKGRASFDVSQGILMKILLGLFIASMSLWVPGVSWAQTGNMMGGGTWDGGWMGGYAWMWMPILLVAVVGVVAWIVKKDGK